MQIKTTGLEEYMPGGSGRLKIMVIGGPGAGKTRWSSFWPSPFYLDCEGGLASVADRAVPYTEIHTSEDMLKALKWLKVHPDARKYGTVVVDTLDAFSRKIQQEWLDNEEVSTFRGYDAWGYLDAKMQMLLTRLLSLDKNVIVLVHYKEKTITEKIGNQTQEHTELMLQLKGDVKDAVFNDFDLVGWMGTFWEPNPDPAVGGRIESRALTFDRTPDKPFLKDRLFIMPRKVPVDFDESDHKFILERFYSRLDELKDGEVVGEISDVEDPDDAPAPVPIEGRGGPVKPQDPKKMPLDQLTKKELMKKGKEEFGLDLKQTLLKDEMVQELEKARDAKAAEAEKPSENKSEDKSQDDATAAAPAEGDASSATPTQEDEAAPAATESGQEDQAEASTDVEAPGEAQVADEPTEEAPKEAAEAEVEAEAEVQPEVQQPTAEAEASDTASGEPEFACEVCGKDLSGENSNYVKLAYIKFRQHLCGEHYTERKSA